MTDMSEDKHETVEPSAIEDAEAAGEAALGAEGELDAATAKAVIDGLQQENETLRDKLMRVMADSENVRRRAEKEKADASKFAITRFAKDLLSVADNFQRALSSLGPDISEDSEKIFENMVMGIEMTERELMAVFERYGITRVDPAPGEKFDPNLHQAIAEIPHDSHPTGSVVDVTQVGYILDDRLLRPAMVVVARGNAGGGAGKGPQGQAGGGPGAAESEPDVDRSAEPGGNINTTA